MCLNFVLPPKWMTTFCLVSITLENTKWLLKIISKQKQTSISLFTFCSFYSSIPWQEPVSTPWSARSAHIVTSSKAEIGSLGKIDISFVSGGYRLPMPAFDQKYCSLKTIGSNFFFVICKVLNLTSWQDWYQLFIRRLSIANRAKQN